MYSILYVLCEVHSFAKGTYYGENIFMSIRFFGPRGWLPLAVTFALVIRTFLRSVLAWERSLVILIMFPNIFL